MVYRCEVQRFKCKYNSDTHTHGGFTQEHSKSMNVFDFN